MHDAIVTGFDDPRDGVNDPPAFEELDEVALAAPVRDTASGRELPAGARGTVVGIWRDGCAYEVEFTEPFECLVTVQAAGLSA